MRRRHVPDPVAEIPDALRRCEGSAEGWFEDLFGWADAAGVDRWHVLVRVAWRDGTLEVEERR